MRTRGIICKRTPKAEGIMNKMAMPIYCEYCGVIEGVIDDMPYVVDGKKHGGSGDSKMSKGVKHKEGCWKTLTDDERIDKLIPPSLKKKLGDSL